MQKVIHLTASASYGNGGKQYIARITGRDAKFTFAREFIGRKGGKRGESSEADVDDAGLYITCDIDRKGNKDETYVVIEEKDGGLVKENTKKEDAMTLAKLLDSVSFREASLKVFGESSAYWAPPETRTEEMPEMVPLTRRQEQLAALRALLADVEARTDWIDPSVMVEAVSECRELLADLSK